MSFDFQSTAEINIPTNPLDCVIGQEEAVKIARVAAFQKRHVLLVGSPGTGKSMLAQAMASLLPKPCFEISVLHNLERAERPILEIKSREQIEKENKENKERNKEYGTIIHPSQAPVFVSEKFGFRCRRCGGIGPSTIPICQFCGANKSIRNVSSFDNAFENTFDNTFENIIFGLEREKTKEQKQSSEQIQTSHVMPGGKEKIIIYEKTPFDTIRVLSQEDCMRMHDEAKKKLRKIIVPLLRSTFVQVSGANETELLGDVKHDPYGGHPEIGIQPYMCVVAGAVHEAHEGVLFIDELSTIGDLQRYLLTAMQEKVFSISGRNPTGTGAIVKVENVPCDFILVGAVNITDLNSLLPALRSRIRGDGYEILMKSYMEDNEYNRNKLVQFIAQEIVKDGKIPHADKTAVSEIFKESKKWAKEIDSATGFTLRLRGISGIIKLAGDLAIMDKSEFIYNNHVKEALKHSKSVEEQIQGAYPNWWKAGAADYALKQSKVDDAR